MEKGAESVSSAPYRPPGVRGSCGFMHNGVFHIHSGCLNGGEDRVDAHRDLECLNLDTLEWSVSETNGDEIPVSVSGACCAVIGDCLYVFGGWMYGGFRNANIHQLNLLTLVWNHLKAKNRTYGPIVKDKAGMVPYGEGMLCVFGGYGGYPAVPGMVHQTGARYEWDHNALMLNCWTNELHVFHIEDCCWFSPEVTGVRPPPCAAFSFTPIDHCRVALFGGRQLATRTNQLHILDMAIWHWSGVILPCGPEAPWPAGRSFHCACSLVDPNWVDEYTHSPLLKHGSCDRSHEPARFEWLLYRPPVLSQDHRSGVEAKLLVVWGMDNDANPIDDGWILNFSSLTWKQAVVPRELGPPRVWFTMAPHYPTPYEAQLVTFGGSDQNLFAFPEASIVNNAKTTVLHFGVRSLYRLCLEHIALGYSKTYAHALHLLPMYLQKQVLNSYENLGKFTSVRF